MRKLVFLLVVAALAVQAACAAPTPTPQSVQATEPASNPQDLAADIVLWTSPMTGSDEKPLYDELIRRFNEEYPGINVTVEFVPWADRDAKFAAALAAGQTPDLAYVFVEGILGWVKDGVLEPLDPYISEANWNDVLPLWQKASTEDIAAGAEVESKIWMLPYLANGVNYIYNKELFEQAGLDPEKPPTTWQELLDVCAQVKALGEEYYCFPLLGKNGYNLWMPFWWQAGGDMFSADMQTVRINDEAGLEAMTFIKTIVDNGYSPLETINNDAAGGEKLWTEGHLALRTFWAAEAPTVNPPFEYGYVPTLMNKAAKSFAAYGGWGMFSGSQNKEAAGAFLDFMMRPENITFWLQWVAAHGTQFQGTTKTTVDLITSNNPVFSAIVADQATNGNTHQLSPGYLTYIDALAEQVEAVELSGKDPKEAVDDAAEKIQELMQDY